MKRSESLSAMHAHIAQFSLSEEHNPPDAIDGPRRRTKNTREFTAFDSWWDAANSSREQRRQDLGYVVGGLPTTPQHPS